MQFTLLARKIVNGVKHTVATQYGTDSVKKAINYAQRIWLHEQGFNEWEAIRCHCENNGDLCPACELLDLYKQRSVLN
jgi:hypothetical protein